MNADYRCYATSFYNNDCHQDKQQRHKGYEDRGNSTDTLDTAKHNQSKHSGNDKPNHECDGFGIRGKHVLECSGNLIRLHTAHTDSRKGTKYRGEFEERLKAFIKEEKEKNKNQ